MTDLKISILGLAVSLLTLIGMTHAQEQSISEPHHRWLNCFYDWLSTEETVGSSFSVKLSFHGVPVAGAQIALNKDGKATATARTDHDGVAHFQGIAPGKYHPETPDGLLFPSSILDIQVKAKIAPGDQVKLDWPSNSPAAYRFLRGRFTISEREDAPEVPLRNIVVELRDVYTGRLIESSSTDANGDYQFSTSDSGLYALRLILPKKGHAGFENRDLGVELDPSAKEYAIPEMKVVQTDCYGVELFRRSSTNEGWEAQ